MGVTKFHFKNPKLSFLPTFKCLLSVTISEKSDANYSRKVHKVVEFGNESVLMEPLINANKNKTKVMTKVANEQMIK